MTINDCHQCDHSNLMFKCSMISPSCWPWKKGEPYPWDHQKTSCSCRCLRIHFFGSDHRWGDVPPAECGDQWNQWMIHGFFLGKIGHRKCRKAMAFDIVLTIMMMGVSGFNFPMNDLMPGYSKHFNTRIAIGIV